MSGNLTAALAYSGKLGWAVIPLHSVRADSCCTCGNIDCDSIGKHPRTEHGLHDATKNPEVIAQYWKRWPDANIGVRTGAASGIVVIDIDSDAGGEYSLEDLESEIGKLPDTVQQQTGSGGRHLIFNHPGEEVPNSIGNLGSGIDVRGDDGYIIVPPSANQSGPYIWEDSSHPLQVAIAELPTALLEKLVSPNGRYEGHAPEIVGTIPKGQRNSTLTSMAGSMRNRGGEQAEIRAALLEMNKRCEPPLSDGEVSRIAASVARYPHAEIGPFDAVQSEQAANRSLILTPAATRETKPARWTWEDRIPAGEITLTVGLGGVGKSTFHAWMIAQITKGVLPGLHWGTPMACIICAQEDSWGRTIVPRLIAADANLDMVYRVDVVEAGEDMRLTLPVDIEALTSEIEAKKVALVSLDPVMSLISGTIDTHKDHEVR